MTPSHPNRLVELMRSVERIEIPFVAIRGIHPEVPVACIDSYPKREDDYLRLTDTAVSMLLLQHPVGAVDDSPQEPGRGRKYLVVSGLDTWRAALAHRLQVPAAKPRGRKPKVPLHPGQRPALGTAGSSQIANLRKRREFLRARDGHRMGTDWAQS